MRIKSYESTEEFCAPYTKTHREHFLIRYIIPHTQYKVNVLAFFQYFLYKVSFVSLTWNDWMGGKSVIENLLLNMESNNKK